jgi:hypothetical protein
MSEKPQRNQVYVEHIPASRPSWMNVFGIEIDFSSQRARLKDESWSCMVETTTHDWSGREKPNHLVPKSGTRFSRMSHLITIDQAALHGVAISHPIVTT